MIEVTYSSHSGDCFNGMKIGFRVGRTFCIDIAEKLVLSFAVEDAEKVLVTRFNGCRIRLISNAKEYHVTKHTYNF